MSDWHLFMNSPQGVLLPVDPGEKDYSRLIRVKSSDGHTYWAWYEPTRQEYHVSVKKPLNGYIADDEIVISKSDPSFQLWMWREVK